MEGAETDAGSLFAVFVYTAIVSEMKRLELGEVCTSSPAYSIHNHYHHYQPSGVQIGQEMLMDILWIYLAQI